MNIPVSASRSVMLLALLTASPVSWGGNMVFQFINPNFGGNPNNGAFLLNEAQAQNTYNSSALPRLPHSTYYSTCNIKGVPSHQLSHSRYY